jgi:DNA-binding CsgD family transcriptional regulator
VKRISKAEMEVVKLILQGYTREQTALHLNKKVNTVKSQLHSVYAVLGIRDVGQLAAYFQGVEQQTVSLTKVLDSYEKRTE